MRLAPLAPPTLLLLPMLLMPAGVASQTYYADVRPVLVQECMGCHSEDGIAWSMEDPEETFEERRRIAGAVAIRKMPPWLAEPGHQEYVGAVSYTHLTLPTNREV